MRTSLWYWRGGYPASAHRLRAGLVRKRFSADEDSNVLGGVEEGEVGRGGKSIYWRTVVKNGPDEGVVEK